MFDKKKPRCAVRFTVNDAGIYKGRVAIASRARDVCRNLEVVSRNDGGKEREGHGEVLHFG